MNISLQHIARGTMLSLLPFASLGQPDTTGTKEKYNLNEEQREAFRNNQRKLDWNHGGIGISIYKPNLGKITHVDAPWIDVNMISDIFELRFGLGTCRVDGNIPYGFDGTVHVKNKQFGYHFYAGVNIPLDILTTGAQHSPYSVLRGHPTVGTGIGAFNMTNQAKYQQQRTAQIWYWGINPGYRIRFPFGSIEANLNIRLGFSTGDESDYFKGFAAYPSVTFRIDALKWKYNPNMVYVPASQTTLSNIQSTTTHTGSGYKANGTRVDYYTTHTTADVHVTNFNMGVQDIGPHAGIGPKVSFMSPKRSPYIPTAFLFGAVAEGRGGPMDIGITLEGGRVGHGGKLEAKSDTGKYRRKLDRGTTSGQGYISTINCYAQIGMDISPIFLIPFGITFDKGEATSYFSATAGFNFGAHFSFGQQFIDNSDYAAYDAKVEKNAGAAKKNYIDPSEARSGYLGGFYLSVQIGAMSFKVTNYRYYGAPFASTSMFSIAYRFPLTGH